MQKSSPAASHKSAAPDSDLGAAATQHIVEGSPIPKSIAVRSHKRKVQAAEVVTSSPFKQRLLEQTKLMSKRRKREKNKQEAMKTGQQKTG